jgi:concentrative nucleoside transporter, CNT family
MVTLLAIAFGLSNNRARIPWRLVAWGLGLQFAFALIILKTPVGVAVFGGVNDVIVALLGFTTEGARFLFGNLVFNNVPVGFGEPGNAPITPDGTVAQTGAFFAFSVLPTIVFFSALMTVLYYFGIMQWVVKGMAWVMMRTMKTSGAETLSAAGNIFLGQTEAPLLVKPFVARMTLSELMAVMTGGFATVAGGVMAAYVGLLIFFFPDIAGHLLAASVMSAPAALVFAKIMVPETEVPETLGSLKVSIEKPDANAIDAAARGAGEGLTLAFNVGAMLLAFIALIALINALIGLFGEWTGLTSVMQGWAWLAEGQRLNLESILGWLLAPLAWLMGVPWQDATTIGGLLGLKTAVNEFIAYLRLSDLLSGGADLQPRSVIIATYALCGFANFSSIAIQIGGLGGIAPSRRSDLARLGLRAMVAGTLAAFMTATIAGMLI